MVHTVAEESQTTEIGGADMKAIRFIAPLALGVFFPAAVLAEVPPIFIVPLQGQDEPTINQDKSECEMWTYEQIGFPEGYVPPENAGEGSVAKSAAIGTVAGAAVGAGAGAIGGRPGVGAAAGAGAGLIGGLVIGSKKKKKAQEEAEAEYQTKVVDYNNHYTRAMTACLTARGYQVS